LEPRRNARTGRWISESDAFQEFNRFLDIALGASFDNAAQFSSWLNGSNAIPFRWPTAIDNKARLDDSNIELPSKSLLYVYAKRLAHRAPAVKAVSKVKPYGNALDALTAATPPSRAPYFLTWFYDKLQGELRVIAQEFQEERNQRFGRRLHSRYRSPAELFCTSSSSCSSSCLCRSKQA